MAESVASSSAAGVAANKIESTPIKKPGCIEFEVQMSKNVKQSFTFDETIYIDDFSEEERDIKS